MKQAAFDAVDNSHGHSNVGSFSVMFAIVYALGDRALPTEDAGWVGLIGVACATRSESSFI